MRKIEYHNDYKVDQIISNKNSVKINDIEM